MKVCFVLLSFCFTAFGQRSYVGGVYVDGQRVDPPPQQKHVYLPAPLGTSAKCMVERVVYPCRIYISGGPSIMADQTVVVAPEPKPLADPPATTAPRISIWGEQKDVTNTTAPLGDKKSNFCLTGCGPAKTPHK